MKRNLDNMDFQQQEMFRDKIRLKFAIEKFLSDKFSTLSKKIKLQIGKF